MNLIFNKIKFKKKSFFFGSFYLWFFFLFPLLGYHSLLIEKQTEKKNCGSKNICILMLYDFLCMCICTLCSKHLVWLDTKMHIQQDNAEMMRGTNLDKPTTFIHISNIWKWAKIKKPIWIFLNFCLVFFFRFYWFAGGFLFSIMNSSKIRRNRIIIIHRLSVAYTYCIYSENHMR